MADFDLRFILPNQLNPELIPKIGVPIARPSNIIDDPMAAYRQSMKNAFAPNILEGVNNFRAIVLLRETTKDGLILNQDVNTEGYKDPEVETEEDKKQKSPTNVQFQQPQQDLTLLTCMIPELHLHLPNPFQAGDVETYLKIVKAFYPKFPFPNGSVPDINTTEIQKVMTKKFKKIDDYDLAVDAAKFMEKNKIFTLIVQEKNKTVGVISMHDLIEARIL